MEVQARLQQARRAAREEFPSEIVRVFMIVSAFILFGIGELLFFDLRDKQ